jgi:hypothetical protein
VGKVLANVTHAIEGGAKEVAECAVEGLPLLPSLGACIAAPSIIDCVSGAQGAVAFLKKCCGTISQAPQGNQAVKNVCEKLAMK